MFSHKVFLNLGFILTLITNSLNVAEIELRLQMREETAPFTGIGSVQSVLPSNIGNQLHFLTDSTFFTVTPTTGEVRVGRLIDRERLCPEYKFCCGVVLCELKASIFVTNKEAGEFAASVLLKVEIQDQNDNRPIFNSPTQTVSLSEAAAVGTHISIVSATDADVDPVNQIRRYTLVESTGTFELDTSALPAIRLELVKPLDREQIAEYRASLEACDPGACARQTLEIQITDENDNHPVMTEKRLTKTLIENMTVGSVVMKLNATDPDSGERGRILFSFHGAIDTDLPETFELVRDTGEIRLKRPLAANIRDRYEFKVIACDAVNRQCSGTENSTAEVHLTVQDVNNFPPSIHAVAAGVAATGVSSPRQEVDQTIPHVVDDYLSVLENSPPSQIAVLTVRDDDTGENARVSCSLNDTQSDIFSKQKQPSQDFMLTLNAPGIYSLRTARVLDFEVESTVRATVVCHDFGKPQQLTSARVITVRVIDVNEFQPEFSRRVYVGRVPENAPAGLEILTTTAIDRDKDAVLRYHLAPMHSDSVAGSLDIQNDHNINSHLNDGLNRFFSIESETGIIRTSQIPIDRETVGSVTLVVLVTDSIVPPVFTASTTVSIEILDENDNAPVFVNPPMRGDSDDSTQKNLSKLSVFKIMENSPRFTQLSQKLEAKDPDQGDNGRVQFSLLATYALTKPMRRNNLLGIPSSTLLHAEASLLSDESEMMRHIVDQPIFRITPSGAIETLVELDREAVSTYILKIGVRDRGAQPLASTTMLTVIVEDANDNAPVWIFPTPVDHVINLTAAMKPGSLAGRLQAEDADTAEAGLVEYMFLGPRGELIEGVSVEEGLLNTLSPPKIREGRSIKSTNGIDGGHSKRANKLKGYRIGPLYLNGSTGEIWIAQTLSPGTINLHLRAEDQGTPQSHTDAWLTINVFTDPSEGSNFLNLGDGALNVTIILAMITVTAIISLFLIIGIVCVRRRPTRYTITRQGTSNGPVSPGHATTTFTMDINKDGMQPSLMSGDWQSPIGFYGPNHYMHTQNGPGSTIIEDGHMFTALQGPGGVMGYGAVVSPTDTGSMIYVPQAQPLSMGGAATPIPMDMTPTGLDFPNRNQMHTFGTLTRNRGSSINTAIYAGPGGYPVSHEPHLDADSGDSGRGPSEEGHQLLMNDNYRNGMNIPGIHGPYQHNTYAGHRPSSRIGFYKSPASGNNVPIIHDPNCQYTKSGGLCTCYVMPDGGITQDNMNGYIMYPRINPYNHPINTFDRMTGAHYSTQDYSSQENHLPPLPPPRTSQMPTSTIVIRRPHMANEQVTQSDINSIYMPNSHPQYPQPSDHSSNNICSANRMIENNGSDTNYAQNCEAQYMYQLNGLQPPLKLDLRNQVTDKYNSTDEMDQSLMKKRRLIGAGLGPGLPPLATKSAVNSSAVSVSKSIQNKTNCTTYTQSELEPTSC